MTAVLAYLLQTVVHREGTVQFPLLTEALRATAVPAPISCCQHRSTIIIHLWLMCEFSKIAGKPRKRYKNEKGIRELKFYWSSLQNSTPNLSGPQ